MSTLSDGLNWNIGAIKQAETPSLLGANIGVNGLTYDDSLSDGVFANNSNFNFSLGGATNGTSTPTFWQNMLGYTDQNGNQMGGWGNTALGVLKSGLGFYLGSQQLSQAEDALAENKKQFNLNYNAQKELINDQLRWQYNARKNANSNYDGTLTQIA